MPERAKKDTKARTLVVETRTAPVTEAAKISAAAVSTAVECRRLETETASMHLQCTRASEGDRCAIACR
jgi:hypothetical protein